MTETTGLRIYTVTRLDDNDIALNTTHRMTLIDTDIASVVSQLVDTDTCPVDIDIQLLVIPGDPSNLALVTLTFKDADNAYTHTAIGGVNHFPAKPNELMSHVLIEARPLQAGVVATKID